MPLLFANPEDRISRVDAQMDLDARKTYLQGFVNNKGTDQPAQFDQHLCYLFIGKYHILTCYEQNFNFLISLCS